MTITDTLQTSRQSLSLARRLAPGLAVCAAAAAVSLLIGWLGLSPMLVAVLLGVLVGNLLRLPETTAPGIAFTARTLLRAGIVLLGLQLTIAEILALGPGMIAVVIAVVVIGIFSTLWIGRRLGVGQNQRLLIACGFSICGAAAVAAVDGVIDAEEDEVVTAVALVVAFGTAMLAVVPGIASLLGLSQATTGLWAGASIHEVAQVVAVGGSLGAAALNAAVVVKLARVLLLAPVMAVLATQRRRSAAGTTGKRPPIMPLFVAGFLAMVALRSLGLVPTVVVDVAATAQTALLTAAMFALGTGASFAAFRRLGARPLILATASTVVVAAVALGGTLLFAN